MWGLVLGLLRPGAFVSGSTKAAASNGLHAQLVLLIAGQICIHAAMAGMRMAAPLLAMTQGYGKASIGALVALFAVTQIFLALPAGRLADRHGIKRPIALSVVAASIGIGSAALWPIYPVLCFSALCSGGAHGVAVIAFQRHVSRIAVAPAQLKQAFSWLSIAPTISLFLGPFAAGLIIDSAGYQVAFLVLAALPLSTWLFVRTLQGGPQAKHPWEPVQGSAWSLWREPNFRNLLLMNALMSLSWDLHAFIVPVLGHERGLSATVIGTILAGFAIAATISRLAMPTLVRKVPEWALITASLVVAGLLFGLYPFAHSPLGMGLCSFLIGMTLGCVQPTVMVILHQVTPHHQHGEALAIRLMMINASAVVMPLLFGSLGGLLGASAVLWLVGVVVGTGSSLGLSLRSVERDHPKK